MNKLLQLSMTLLLISSLAGCGTHKNATETVKKNMANNTTTTTTVEPPTTTVETPTTNGQIVNDGVNGNNGHKLEVADDAAKKIVEMKEVESANVIVTDHNAYVAAKLKSGVNDSKELEKKIAEKVRSTKGDFNNVYVSTNPDLSKQFTDYAKKIKAGEPVEGFFKEFSDTIKRVFPDAH